MSSSKRPASPLLGEVIGQRFVIKEHLDNTGQADVYLAEHVLVHRDVALKVSRAGADPTDEMVTRFQRVARVAAQLDHPHILKVNDFGLDDRGYVFLATELGPGRDLKRILAKDGPLTSDEVVSIGLQILDGLGEAHRRGILHTELQPKYIMVDLSTGLPAVKLLGFGLGQLMRGIERGEAAQGTISGEAAQFAAPELLGDGATVDHRADLFAVGAVLFTALTGETPWPKAGSNPLSRAHQPAPRASQVRSDGRVTMGLDRLLSQALDPDPARRFSDAAQMAAALRRASSSGDDEVSSVEAVHRTFGRYKLLRSIAQGGMGELHLAVAETLPGITKVCALKRLHPALAAERSYVDRFLEEASLAAQLAHANLATVYDVGKAEDSFYMAMEYVVGKDCRRIIDRGGEDGISMPCEVAIFIARELADALAYAHRVRLSADSVGLIHRDVSPTNVMLTYEGQVKLIDFGLAKHATSVGKTETGVVIGKVAYMAPEQCLGDSVDTRADIFSVGAVLYELLTGRRLREVADLERLADLVQRPSEVEIRRFRKDAPAELDLVLAKTLAVDPRDRYQQAEGLRDDLTQVLLDLQPRMSRDVVAAFMRTLFAAEARSEMDLAQVLRTEAAPVRPQSVLPEGGGAVRSRGRTEAMDAVDPRLLLGEGMELLGATDPRLAVEDVEAGSRDDTMVAANPLLFSNDDLTPVEEQPGGSPAGPPGGSPAPAVESAPSVGPGQPPAKRRGASVTLAVLLLLFGLAGGFAIRDQLLPDFLRPVSQARRAEPKLSGSPPPAHSSEAGPKARQGAAEPQERPAPPECPPTPEARPPGPEEIRRLVQSELSVRLEKLAAADLHALGVGPGELAVLPGLHEAYQPLVRALAKDDLGEAIAAIGAFRAALASPRLSCRRLRQAKFKWVRDRLRDLRRAAPRRRADRKTFNETHGIDGLKEQLEELRKRSQDDSLTCPQQSLGYAQLIPQMLKTLQAAEVPRDKWRLAKGAEPDLDGEGKPKGGEDKPKGGEAKPSAGEAKPRSGEAMPRDDPEQGE